MSFAATDDGLIHAIRYDEDRMSYGKLACGEDFGEDPNRYVQSARVLRARPIVADMPTCMACACAPDVHTSVKSKLT